MACTSIAATISITCSPAGGRLYKDNVLWISNTIDYFQNCVTPGYHTFRYEADGYEAQEVSSYYYYADTEYPLYFNLPPSNACGEPGYAKIIFHCSPYPATVYIFGGSGYDYGLGVERCLQVGTHEIRWEKEGYKDEVYTITVTQNMTETTYVYNDYAYLEPHCTQATCPSPEKTCENDVCVDSPICNSTNCPYPMECEGNYICSPPDTPCGINASMHVVIDPLYSSIFIDGYEFATGVGASGTEICFTAPGTYTISYQHEGYTPVTETISVTPYQILPDRNIILTSLCPTCPTGQHCDASTGYVCIPNTQFCTPGAKQCSGKIPQTCNSSGTAWINGTACTGTCTAGVCSSTQVCTPGAKRCSGKVPQTCNAQGTAWADGTVCPVSCVNGVCSASTGCTPPCTSPATCQNVAGVYKCVDSTHACSITYPTGFCPTGQVCNNGVCEVPSDTTPCVGLTRSGEFDPTCILEKGNEMYLYGFIGIAALAIIMMKRK